MANKKLATVSVVRLHKLPHLLEISDLKKFFSQFGTIKRTIICRSAKTGNSKGFAFIEFVNPEVAKAVTDSLTKIPFLASSVKLTYTEMPKAALRYLSAKNSFSNVIQEVKNRTPRIIEKLTTVTTLEADQIKDTMRKKLIDSGIPVSVEPLTSL